MSQPQTASPGTLIAEPGYERLVAVMKAAHNQAAHGKGKERHANDLPFEEQRMLSICKLQGSPDGMTYQVIKKLTEGLAMPEHHRKVAELYGAINYLAGIVIFLEDLQGEPVAAAHCHTCDDEGVVPMNGGRPFAPCPDCRGEAGPTPDELATAELLKSARACSTCHDVGAVKSAGGQLTSCPDCTDV